MENFNVYDVMTIQLVLGCFNNSTGLVRIHFQIVVGVIWIDCIKTSYIFLNNKHEEAGHCGPVV